MGWFGRIDRTSVGRCRCIATGAYPAATHVVGRSPVFVVGSLSSVSRRQAERLAREDIVVLAIEEAMLNNNSVCMAALVDHLAAALATGKDVLILSTPK